MSSFLCTAVLSAGPVLDLVAQLLTVAGALVMIMLCCVAASYGLVLGVLLATRWHGPISFSFGRFNVDLVDHRWRDGTP